MLIDKKSIIQNNRLEQLKNSSSSMPASSSRFVTKKPTAPASIPNDSSSILPRKTANSDGKSIFEKSDMGILRTELRETLRKMKWDNSIKMNRQQRIAAEKELFDKKAYGGYAISKRDVDLKIRRLKLEQKTPGQRIQVQRKINLLNKLKNTKLK